jgi:hypothetical protein
MTPAKLKCHGTTGVGGRAARAAQPARHAAGTGERAEVIRENSRREAPRMSSDLIRRSKHRGIACLHLRDARLVRWEAFCEVGLREISAPPTIVKDCGQPTFEVNVRSLLGTQPQRLSRCAGTFQPPWPPGVVASLHARRGRVQRGPRGVGGLRPLVERPGSSPWRLHRAKERRARDPVRASAQLPEPEP